MMLITVSFLLFLRGGNTVRSREICCNCLLVRVKEYASVTLLVDYLLLVLMEFTGTVLLIIFNAPNLCYQNSNTPYIRLSKAFSLSQLNHIHDGLALKLSFKPCCGGNTCLQTLDSPKIVNTINKIAVTQSSLIKLLS